MIHPDRNIIMTLETTEKKIHLNDHSDHAKKTTIIIKRKS